ncbi:hypothetical protein AVEN_222166-1 [Araneus ventricosus]|uniref:Histone-lysine N-methyltransferase SETMAR n=1 Tax=Araneus ventricosus TaxID=182803 RepID=A0A4Y2FNQ8_ARAVE|nr:hypothetical protein AVEN_222166-1 [Araneus ventricosus]
MAGRINVPAKCEVRSFTRFLQTEDWFMENDQCSCFLSDFKRLRRAILTSGDVLIHDITRPHSVVVTQQLLEQFKWDVSDHSAYSPDLVTSDFYLVPELKNWMGGQSFQKNEAIQSSVKDHLISTATRESETLSTGMINA